MLCKRCKHEIFSKYVFFYLELETILCNIGPNQTLCRRKYYYKRRDASKATKNPDRNIESLQSYAIFP